MAIFSSLNSRRKSSHQSEATQTVITFYLRNHGFALPVTSVQKVVFLDKLYGDPQGTGVSLTRYQNQEILVIDVGYKIFGELPKNLQELDSFNEHQQRYLAILSHSSGSFVGLPLDSPPAVKRIPNSGFTAIPDTYLATGNLQCISETMIKIDELPPTFLLEPKLLMDNYLKKWVT